MSFISFEFLIALPVAALIYYLIPARYRYLWICALSLAFYATQGVRLLVVMMLSIVSTYAAGMCVRVRTSGGGSKGTVTHIPLIVGVIFNVALILVFKYTGMFFPAAGERLIDAGLFAPIGLSFYVLQAAGYVIDCYRGDIEPEKNFFLYAAFVSFFPLVISGPIERAPKMIPQLKDPKGFDYDTVRDGLLMMVWGFFLKLVLADRIAILVNTAYASPASYAGGMMMLSVLLYSVQIYCDFMGYSYIAAGTARALGFGVIDNFDAPYLSETIADFWRRWHRSLSFWFRDYLYIPLGGSKQGTWKKIRNLLIIFAVSGLWHGAAWRFVLWGLVHGLYQVAGCVRVNASSGGVKGTLTHFSARLFRKMRTFFLVSFAWIFFRAEDMDKVGAVVRSMFIPRIHQLLDGTLVQMGLDTPNVVLMFLAIAVLVCADILRDCGVRLLEALPKQGTWLRWSVYIAAIVLIVICGVWGEGYDASSFIYAQF